MPPTLTPTLKKVNFYLAPSSSDARINASFDPSSSTGKSPMKRLLPKLINFKYKNSGSDVEKATALASGVPQEELTLSKAWSLIFNPRTNRTSCLTNTPIARASSESICGGNSSDSLDLDNKGMNGYIPRSLSVPVLSKHPSLRRTDSFIRVVPSTPRANEGTDKISTTATTGDDENTEADAGDIPQEEAVCRICMVELCDGGETLKLECNCKGELALAHRDCAVKWFCMKGTKTCEVCKHEVKNLPVKLLRIRNPLNQITGANGAPQMEVNGFSEVCRVLQEAPILVAVNMTGYFCFLEQILFPSMHMGSIALSLPFSCIMGIFAAVTSSTMVRRRLIWFYASIQLAFVVMFANLLFYVVGWKSIILSIVVATIAGFTITMIGSSILVEFRRRRGRWRVTFDQRDNLQVTGQWPQTAASYHVDHPVLNSTEAENQGTASGREVTVSRR